MPKDIDINKDGTIDIKQGSQYKEHYANVGVANLLYNELISRGYTVIKTGWNDANPSDDFDVSLKTRQSRIRKENCNYSISIHFNASGDGSKFNSAAGVSVYIHSLYPADSKRLADYVLAELSLGTKQINRGVQQARFAMCNCNTMNTTASILCEIAFMTNEHEAEDLMANQSFWKECAIEIADGFERYTGKTGITEYIVQKGDTLYRISLKFFNDTNHIDGIMKLNNLTSSVIYTGQVLKIPQAL